MRVIPVSGLAAAVLAWTLASDMVLGATQPKPGMPPDNFTADEQTPDSLAKPTPAFPGQTAAAVRKSAGKYAVEVVSGGFASPWSLAFLPDGKMLVTESSGTMRVVTQRRCAYGRGGSAARQNDGGAGSARCRAGSRTSRTTDSSISHTSRRRRVKLPAYWPEAYAYDRVFNFPVAERRRAESRHGEGRAGSSERG